MKKIFVLLMMVTSISFAASNPDASLDLDVSLKVVSGIIINKSGDIDFGNVITKTGEVESDPMTLTVDKPSTDTATTVTISADEVVTLSSSEAGDIVATIGFTNGTITGDKATFDASFSGDVATAEMKAILKLQGNEAAAEYTGAVTVTATTI